MDNETFLKKLTYWKECVHATFLLVASALGALALLLLEAGVVSKAWHLHF